MSNNANLEIYEILVAEHEQMLHAYILGLVHDPFQAEDICQEAFVIAYRELSTLKNKAAFPSWLRTIARNLAFAELNKRRLEVPTDPEFLLGMEEVFTATDANTNPAPWEERTRAVRECMASLSTRLLDCCQLYYFEGRSMKDIAAHLGISIAAVLKRIERSRAAIGECVSRKLRLVKI